MEFLKNAFCLLFAMLLLSSGCECFSPTSLSTTKRDSHQHGSPYKMSSDIQDGSSSQSSSRRDFIISSSVAVVGISTLPGYAFAAENIGKSKDSPVAIIGGGGRTGKEVAAALAKEGLYGITITRSGKLPLLPGYAKEFVDHYEAPVNVRDTDGLSSALKAAKASAIVYCASASSQGGNSFQVDDIGVANAATAAKALDARFVLISALGVDRPDSKGFQMTNSLGGNFDKIMDAKRQGEDKVREILAKNKNYMIIRPGPLLGAKSRNGAVDIELNQRDFIGGGISRDELAGVVVGALQSDKKGATVEVYRSKTRQKIQPEFDLFSGNEATADTYVGLFNNVKSD